MDKPRNQGFSRRLGSSLVRDHRSTHKNIGDLRRVLQARENWAYPGRAAPSRTKSLSLTTTVASSFVCTSALAVMTVVEFLDTRTV